MKIKLFSLLLLSSLGLHAQVIVEDPIAIAQDALNQAVNLAKYVEMVNNQVQQLDTMRQELEQVTAYTQAFGDPASLVEITGANHLIDSTRNFQSGSSLGELRQMASGEASISYTGDGLYTPVAPLRIGGSNVGRDPALYRKYGAVESAATNYTDAYATSRQKAEAARSNLADMTTALQSATTDAEVQKLKGAIAAQSAELEALQHEVANAASHVLVQDAENRNAEEKRQEAQAEADIADWSDANRKFDGGLSLPGRKKK